MFKLISQLRLAWCNACIKQADHYEEIGDTLSQEAKSLVKRATQMKRFNNFSGTYVSLQHAYKLLDQSSTNYRLATFWRKLII